MTSYAYLEANEMTRREGEEKAGEQFSEQGEALGSSKEYFIGHTVATEVWVPQALPSTVTGVM